MPPPIDQIVLQDCLKGMSDLPGMSVDSIIADPPYGLGYQSSMRTDKSARFSKIANDSRPFIWWLLQAYRVLKDGGPLLVFIDWRNAETFRMAIELAGFTVRSQVIWDRGVHGMGDTATTFAPQHDIIWFATKGRFAFPGHRPKSVIRSQRISGSQLVHPNEKPVGLIEELIVSVTKESDLVLDPFMGSGTTAVAAINTGRHFIGYELSPEYCAIAEQRIQAALSITQSTSASASA